MTISHESQKEKWEREHKVPYALKQMDARSVSSSIPPFFEILRSEHLSGLLGLEMGCGKGRNTLWCASQPEVKQMTGFDFAKVAIAVAQERATEAGLSSKAQFFVMDATKRWHFDDASFDFGLDCTASTDIEDPMLRQFAVSEMWRTLKSGGLVLVYVMSTDDEYHRLMIEQSPAEEKNAFYHPDTGKFEKVFDEGELRELYRDFELVESRRIDKTTSFFGKEYSCKLFWRIYRK